MNQKIPYNVRYSIVILVKEILDCIDEIASLKSQGYEANISKQILSELCSVLREIDPLTREAYFDALITISSRNSICRPMSCSEQYEKAIAPSKRRLMKKLKGDIENWAA